MKCNDGKNRATNCYDCKNQCPEFKEYLKYIKLAGDPKT
jgi:hypothetical protein